MGHALEHVGLFYARTALRPTGEAEALCPAGSLLQASDQPTGDAVQAYVGPYLAAAHTLGEQTGHLHLTLARATERDLVPEPLTAADVTHVVDGARIRASRTFAHLGTVRSSLPLATGTPRGPADRPAARSVRAARRVCCDHHSRHAHALPSGLSPRPAALDGHALRVARLRRRAACDHCPSDGRSARRCPTWLGCFARTAMPPGQVSSPGHVRTGERHSPTNHGRWCGRRLWLARSSAGVQRRHHGRLVRAVRPFRARTAAAGAHARTRRSTNWNTS